MRKALYFGLFAALGATFGWFSWIAAGILLTKTREVWISALVGGLLGAAIDGLLRYRRTLRASPEDQPVTGFPFLTVLLTASGTFLAAADENSLGEVVKEVRWPFLFSVTTFFVGGLAGYSPWFAIVPAGTTVMAIAGFFLLFGLGPTEETEQYAPVSVPRLGPAISGFTQSLLQAPDVPAQTWTAAQAQLRAGASGKLIEPEIPSFVSGPLGFLAGCDRIPTQPNVWTPTSFLERKRALCRHIDATTNAEWARSVIVVGFFCASLALGRPAGAEVAPRRVCSPSHPQIRQGRTVPCCARPSRGLAGTPS
ncbi:hypothetical protein [Thermocatellispora tengchongensis]|uniref:hypothetical protein n=1 Tax=Thermocatellispora tengchongensis TaxID=1073253 RepID=UPI00363BE178